MMKTEGGPSVDGLTQPAARLNASNFSPQHWLAVVVLLVKENVGLRYRRSRMGTYIAIIEPLFVVAIFAGMDSLGPPRPPPFGRSHVLFFLTGVIPYYLFFHISLRVKNLDQIQRLPGISTVTQVASLSLAELLAKAIILLTASLALYEYGFDEAIPDDIVICIGALLVITVFGTAVGVINACIVAYFYAWNYLYQIAVRVLIVFSGIPLVPDRAPEFIRNIAEWNPLAHAVTMYRVGQWSTYPAATLDHSFVFVSAAIVTCCAGYLSHITRVRRFAL